MIEMFTDSDPMRLDDFKLPADGVRSVTVSPPCKHFADQKQQERSCPISLHDSDGGDHEV